AGGRAGQRPGATERAAGLPPEVRPVAFVVAVRDTVAARAAGRVVGAVGAAGERSGVELRLVPARARTQIRPLAILTAVPDAVAADIGAIAEVVVTLEVAPQGSG